MALDGKSKIEGSSLRVKVVNWLKGRLKGQKQQGKDWGKLWQQMRWVGAWEVWQEAG